MQKRRGAPAADALPPAQRLTPAKLQGPERGEYGADAALEKGAGCCWSWWENWEPEGVGTR